MKIRKPKKVIQPIVKTDVQQIYDDIVKLKDSYKNELLKLQKRIEIVLKM
jgi:hypothetical protein